MTIDKFIDEIGQTLSKISSIMYIYIIIFMFDNTFCVKIRQRYPISFLTTSQNDYYFPFHPVFISQLPKTHVKHTSLTRLLTNLKERGCKIAKFAVISK